MSVGQEKLHRLERRNRAGGVSLGCWPERYCCHATRTLRNRIAQIRWRSLWPYCSTRSQASIDHALLEDNIYVGLLIDKATAAIRDSVASGTAPFVSLRERRRIYLRFSPLLLSH